MPRKLVPVAVGAEIAAPSLSWTGASTPPFSVGGIGRGGDPHAGRAGRTGRLADRVPVDWHEDLDLERAGGGAVSRVRDAGSRGRTWRDHGLPGGEGNARVSVRGTRAKDGDPGVPGSGVGLRRVRVTGGEPPGCRGRGLPDRVVGARGGAHLDRRGVRGAGSGRVGGGGQVSGGAEGVWLATLGAARVALPAGRDGPRGGRGARCHAGRSGGQGPWRAPRRGVLDREVDRLRCGDARRHRRGPAVRRDGLLARDGR